MSCNFQVRRLDSHGPDSAGVGGAVRLALEISVSIVVQSWVQVVRCCAPAGIQSEVAKARMYQNMLVTIPDSGYQPGIVRSVDLDGNLLVELGAFGGDQEVVINSGMTQTLVSLKLHTLLPPVRM